MSDMPTYEVILTDAPGTEAKAVIGEALAAYNTGHAGSTTGVICPSSLKTLGRLKSSEA